MTITDADIHDYLRYADGIHIGKGERHNTGTSPGLHVRIRLKGNTATATYILRATLNGKRRDFTIGTAATMTLADATTEAHRYRSEITAGRDPRPKPAPPIPTFKEAAQAYIDTRDDLKPHDRQRLAAVP